MALMMLISLSYIHLTHPKTFLHYSREGRFVLNSHSPRVIRRTLSLTSFWHLEYDFEFHSLRVCQDQGEAEGLEGWQWPPGSRGDQIWPKPICQTYSCPNLRVSKIKLGSRGDLSAVVWNLAIIINWSFSWYDHPSQMCQNLKIGSLSIVNFNAWNYICPYLIVKDHKMLNTKVWILEFVWFTDVSFFKEGQHRQNPDDCKPDPYGKNYNHKLFWINLHIFLSTSFQLNTIVKVAGAVMWIQTVYTMGFPKGLI